MARAKTDKPFKVFPLELSMEEWATLKRRANAIKIDGKPMSMHAYAIAMLTNGKTPKPAKNRTQPEQR